ncbi:MAG: helix-turn-helix transcriptional regulator [Solirubrobacteraceae bacterium]
MADLPLLVLATLRTGEPQGATLQALGVHARRDRMTLRELSPAASAQLTREALGNDAAEDFCTACHRATNGNPFILRELLEELRREGVTPSREHAGEIARVTPDGVKRAVLLRLSLLSAAARELAVAVAVGGGELALDEAAAIADLGSAAASVAADALGSAGILAPGTPLRFVHPLVREVVYAELPEHDRGERHRRAATRLAEAGADVHRVAVQLLQTPPRGDGWALERLREAGRAALADGAGDAAAQFLRRALGEPPPQPDRVSVLRELAGAEALTESAAAIDRLEEALALATDQRVEAEVGLELLLMLFQHGQIPRAIELSHWLLARVPPGDRGFELRVTAVAVTGAILVPALHSHVDEFLSHIPDDIPGDTTDERFALSARLAESMTRAVPMDEVGELATRVLAGGRLLEDVSSQELLYWNAASALVVADWFEGARDAIEAAFEDARRRGSILGYSLSSSVRCLLAYRVGDIAEGAADGRQALHAAPAGEIHIHAYAVAFLIDCLIERGELSEALALATAPEFMGELPDLFVFHLLRVARARTQIAAGDPGTGVEELLAVADAMRLGRYSPSVCPWRARAVDGLIAVGRRDEARVLAEEALVFAEKTASGWAEAVACQALAAAAPERATELLERAIEIAERRGLGLERARSLVSLGSHHRRHGRRQAATEMLEQGLEHSIACGALVLEERARAELIAAGSRPRRRTQTDGDALTPGERRVADLAAGGMTNREIAQALFVSLRTVETHLTHSYQKLGIDSRAQLAGALAVAEGG